MASEGLIVSDLVVGYGRSVVLHGVSLSVAPGERVAVLGPNGAGKTTLLRTISGLLRARSGSIALDGEALVGRRSEEIVARGVIHVPEGRHVFPDFTVAENLRAAGYTRRGRDISEDTERVLTAFPALRDRLNVRAGFLSGGEQQMLVLGRAVIQEPNVLLVDEMSLGLAPIVITEIYQTLGQLFRGTSILIVEQNPRLALTYCQRAYFMRNGSISSSGPASLFEGEAELASAYLGSPIEAEKRERSDA